MPLECWEIERQALIWQTSLVGRRKLEVAFLWLFLLVGLPLATALVVLLSQSRLDEVASSLIASVACIGIVAGAIYAAYKISNLAEDRFFEPRSQAIDEKYQLTST